MPNPDASSRTGPLDRYRSELTPPPALATPGCRVVGTRRLREFRAVRAQTTRRPIFAIRPSPLPASIVPWDSSQEARAAKGFTARSVDWRPWAAIYKGACTECCLAETNALAACSGRPTPRLRSPFPAASASAATTAPASVDPQVCQLLNVVGGPFGPTQFVGAPRSRDRAREGGELGSGAQLRLPVSRCCRPFRGGDDGVSPRWGASVMGASVPGRRQPARQRARPTRQSCQWRERTCS